MQEKTITRQFILSTILMITCQVAFGQVHWLINADSIPDCNFIKSGKFVNKETDEKVTPGYSIVINDGQITEYVNNSEHYVKSKIEFISDCEYQSTVIEVTIPNYNLGPGTIIRTEIIATALVDNLIEIKSTINETSNYFVLQKIE